MKALRAAVLGCVGVVVVASALVGCAGGVPVVQSPGQAAGSTTDAVTGTTAVTSSADHSTAVTPAAVIPPQKVGTTTTPQGLDTAESAPCATGEGFSISLPSEFLTPGQHGASTPEDAAVSTRWARPPEYGSADTVWTRTSVGSSSVQLQSDEGVRLDVTQLPDHSWVVMSGERCR